jgi:hypothetical protein
MNSEEWFGDREDGHEKGMGMGSAAGGHSNEDHLVREGVPLPLN